MTLYEARIATETADVRLDNPTAPYMDVAPGGVVKGRLSVTKKYGTFKT